MGASSSVPDQSSVHDFTVKDSKGKDVDLSIYKGKVLLIVNVASKWFQADYPIFGKSEVKVNGNNASPLYKYLKANGGGFMGTSIKWNFTKFLISKNGKVIRRMGPTTTPSTIEDDIEKALEEPLKEKKAVQEPLKEKKAEETPKEN
ncbi:probable glutathione peroxidase 5 [Tanacetum coccineum]